LKLDPLLAAVHQSIRKGVLVAWRNLVPMLLLEAAMAAIVAVYYLWPPGTRILISYAAWQHQGGIVAAALATGVAGGVVSELSIVYLLSRGWTAHHVEHMLFKLFYFSISGGIVYVFYGYQTIWFGDENSWPVLARKVFMDQFVFSLFWSNTFTAVMMRWHGLRYSFHKLWQEMTPRFIVDRIFPLIITGWMFWIPGVTLIYCLPAALQVPLFIFATGIWGILMPAIAKEEKEVLQAEEEVVLT